MPSIFWHYYCIFLAQQLSKQAKFWDIIILCPAWWGKTKSTTIITYNYYCTSFTSRLSHDYPNMTFKSCFIPQSNRHCKFQVPEMQILHHIGPYLDMRLHLPYTDLAHGRYLQFTWNIPWMVQCVIQLKKIPCCIPQLYLGVRLG
jgi:hypothetical protein